VARPLRTRICSTGALERSLPPLGDEQIPEYRAYGRSIAGAMPHAE